MVRRDAERICGRVRSGGLAALSLGPFQGTSGQSFENGRDCEMSLASYKIVGTGGEWRIRHGKAENVYETKEFPFEAAVAAASLALRQGHEVEISVPGSKTATGAAIPG
jgi:hypothetical protein